MKIAIIKIIILQTFFCCYNMQLTKICNGKISSLVNSDRNIDYYSETIPNYCDAGVELGWYTFGPDAKMPDFCPQIDFCLADTPFWTRDAQPTPMSPGPFNITLCASESSSGQDDTDCTADCSVKVQTAYCSNINSIVYEFFPVRRCNLRYCYQKLRPCDANEFSLTGYEPCSTEFPYAALSTATITYATSITDPRYIQSPYVVDLKCSISCPANLNCGALGGEVLWYTNASNVITYINTTGIQYDEVKKTLYSFIDENLWTKHVNSYFYCQYKPSLRGIRAQTYFVSPSSYFGLVLNVVTNTSKTYFGTGGISVVLKDTDKSNIKLEIYTTIPILCQSVSAKQCFMTINMVKAEEIDVTLVKTEHVYCEDASCSSCSRQLKAQNVPDPNIKVSWNIFATVESSNRANPSTVKILLQTKGSGKNSFWNNLKLPVISVEYTPQNIGTIFAQSVCDPHIYTFDKSYLNFNGYDGEYLMMANEKYYLWVHAVAKRCLVVTSQHCNDAIYIQSIDDVIIYKNSEPRNLYYVDLSSNNPEKINLGFDANKNAVIIKANKDDSLGAIKVSDDGYKFKIITHFGTTIYLYTQTYGSDIQIYPSKLDKNNVFGLFGDYNGDSTNDLKDTKYGTKATLNDFIQTYKIKEPLMSSNRYYNVTPRADVPIRYCGCSNTTDFTCILGLQQFQIFNTKTFTGKSINNKQFHPKNFGKLSKRIENFEQANQKEHNQNIPIRAARSISDSCGSVLNTTELRECDRQKLIDLSSTIDKCILDSSISGLDIWAQDYLTLTQTACKTKLTEDQNTFVSQRNGRKFQQSSLLAKLCFNNCSNNGVCDNGECQCNKPYEGSDCSIDTSVPAKILNSSFGKNICEIQSDSCTELLLLLDRTTPKMLINYVISYINDDGSFTVIEKETSDILIFNRIILYGKLNLPTKRAEKSLSVLFYNITVSDTTTSNTFNYVIYNEQCHECQNANNCYIKAGKCDINSQCYSEGDKNPFNESQFCSPKTSRFGWTSLWNNGNMIALNLYTKTIFLVFAFLSYYFNLLTFC